MATLGNVKYLYKCRLTITYPLGVYLYYITQLILFDHENYLTFCLSPSNIPLFSIAKYYPSHFIHDHLHGNGWSTQSAVLPVSQVDGLWNAGAIHISRYSTY
jgi:hypothetical protein